MKICLVLILLLFFMFCGSEQPTSPNVDFKNFDHIYVALGNSLTAGYQDSGLSEKAQSESYVTLISQALGLDNFRQLLFKDPGLGGTTPEGLFLTPLKLDLTTFTIRPDTLPYTSKEALLAGLFYDSLLNLARPYNNLGVPGALAQDLLHATNSMTCKNVGNSFFDFILRNTTFPDLSAIEQAVLLNPTIVTLWIGNNDLLIGVLEGDVKDGDNVTSLASYETTMDSIFEILLNQTGAEIFLGNIPPISSIPYVTTVPTKIDTVKINELAPFLPVDQEELRTLKTAMGDDTVYLNTEEVDAQYALLPAMDLLMTDPVSYFKGFGNEIIPSTMTLSSNEVQLINSRIENYNMYLSSKVARSDRITLVDMNSLMSDIENGLYSINAKFFLFDYQNSAFSLDGIHPNSKGYELIAEKFIEVINQKLNMSLTIAE